MKAKPFLVTYEDETKPIRIARQGSKGYLTIKKLMDPEDTGSVSGIVLVAEGSPQQEPITAHAHRVNVCSDRTWKVDHRPNRRKDEDLPTQTKRLRIHSADYYHVVEVERNEPMKLIISYFSTEKKGKSHREIATELTNVPLQGEYGK